MTTKPARLATAAALGSAVLVGCLFPSFDQLGANKSATTDGTDGSASSTPAPTSTTAPTTTTTPPVTVDAGPDATTTPRVPNGVPCSDQVCNAPQYCCANMILDDECRDANEDPELLCADQAAGDARAMRCDGPEDCAAGLVCCFVDQAKLGATCSAACAGAILCHDGTHCPVGQTCAGTLFSRYTFCR